MYQPLPDFPPLYAPGLWWTLYFNELWRGKETSEAIRTANRGCGLKSREWMRLEIKGDCIPMPVEGGGNALKNRHPESWVLAANAPLLARKGDLNLATVYGSTPYFRLLSSDIGLENLAIGGRCKASQICNEAHVAVSEILGIENAEKVKALKEACRENHETSAALSIRIKELFNPNRSILDAVYRFGQETIFALLPAFKF